MGGSQTAFGTYLLKSGFFMSRKLDKKEYKLDFIHEKNEVKSNEVFDEVFFILNLFSDEVKNSTTQEKPSRKGKRSKSSLTQSTQSESVEYLK